MIDTNRQQILKWCDQCVLCGLCVPHCPTYQLENNESESPRGRIVLIQALMRGVLDHKKSDLASLEHCLLCRSCEAVCPSKVPYGEIIALARDEIKPKQSGLVYQLMDAVAEPKQMQSLRSKLKFYRGSGIQKLVRGSGLLRGEYRAAEGMLKFISTESLKDYYPAISESRGEVLLYGGCMGETFDQQTVIDAISLLNRLGFGVRLNHPSGCCGAMHHHNGDVKTGSALRAATQNTLSKSNADYIVGLASSCVARLNEKDGEELPITELTDFLITYKEELMDGFSPMKLRVAVHRPCTNKNLLKNFDKTLELLNHLPGLELAELPTYGCCGASGTHMVSDAEHARKFLYESLRWLRTEGIDLIVSQNMGCMLHLSTE
ncbi:MAG: (Fe-S)-binding protein, partial [Gammaproteobacteria bacterium]|nr:(Fe-S)-binding protein [Gammaproteobacteria bacterium]